MLLQQSLILILAALAGVALLLAYYLQRHQAPQVQFSATKFLPQATPIRVLRSAFPPLRLLIPIVALVLIVLSMAQPAVSQTQSAPLGLIIDDRAFSGSETQSAPLRHIALAVADKISPNTHWGLFATSGATLAEGSGQEEMAQLLQTWRTQPSGDSYSPGVFMRAANFLKERTGATPVLLLVGSTDTFLGFPGLDSLRADMEKQGIKMLLVSSQTSSRPAFIAATDAPRLSALNTEVRARFGVANTGDNAIEGELRLLSGDKVVGRANVQLPARSLSWQEVKLTPKSSGLTKYRVVLSPNVPGAPEDETTWELTALAAQNVVIIASPSNSNPGFVEKAFRSSPLVGNVTIIDPEALDGTKLRQTLASTRVVVLDGVDAALFPTQLGMELRTWVESGGTLVFACGPKTSQTWSKNPLSAVMPATLKAARAKTLQGVSARESAVTRNLELESAPLAVSQYITVDPPPAPQVLIAAAGEPLLVYKSAGKGTVFLWTSTSDPRWNNWAQHPSFPVFWSNVLVYAVAGDTATVSPQLDATRTLWRSATSSPAQDIYYLDDAANPVVLPAPLRQALERPVESYRDYHLLALAAGVGVIVVYVTVAAFSRRRARR